MIADLSDWKSLPAQVLWAIGWIAASNKKNNWAAESRVATSTGWAVNDQTYQNDSTLRAEMRSVIDALVSDGHVASTSSQGAPDYYDRLRTNASAVPLINSFERSALDRDLPILHDLQEFAKENRVLTAVVLSAAMAQGKHAIHGAELRDSEVPIVQRTLRAKIYQEFMLGVEEAGALLVAIQRRDEGGIFSRYLNGQVREVTAIMRSFADQPTALLEEVLRLPERAKLQELLPDQPNLSAVLDDVRDWLRAGANMYLSDNELLVKAMNKTKHGFVLVNDIRVLDSRQTNGASEQVNIVVRNAFGNRSGTREATFEVAHLSVVPTQEPPEIELLRRVKKVDSWAVHLMSDLRSAGADLTRFGK